MILMIPHSRGKTMWGGLKEVRKRLGSAFILMSCWGVLIGSILLNPILVRANGPGQDPQTEDGIPSEFLYYFEWVGQDYCICPELLEAIAFRESRFKADAENKNCKGLMQINVKIHKKRIEKYGWTEADMLDPYKNLMLAADYLAELYELYGDDNPIVLSIYSGNYKAVNKYKEYGIMCDYAEKVLNQSAEYERIHGK